MIYIGNPKLTPYRPGRFAARLKVRLLGSVIGPITPNTKPALTGDLVPGSTLVATPGSWNGTPSLAYQITRDGIQVGTTSYNFTSNDAGRVFAVVETDTVSGQINRSPTRIGTADAIIYKNTFDSYPDGTGLSTLPGWKIGNLNQPYNYASLDAPNAVTPLYGKEELKIYSGSLAAAASGTAQYGTSTNYVYDAGVSDYSLNMDYAQFWQGDGGYGNTYRQLHLRASGNSSRISLSISYNTIDVSCYYPYNAASYPDEPNYQYHGQVILPHIWKEGDKVKVVVKGDYLQIYFNNIRVGNLTINSGQGYNVSRVARSNNLLFTNPNTDSNAGTLYPFPLWRGMEITTPLAKSIIVTSAEVTNPTESQGGAVLALTGTVLGNVTSLEYLLRDRDYNVVTDWTPLGATFNDSSWFKTLSGMPHQLEGGNTYITIRDANDRTTAITITQSFLEYQSIPTFIKGMNEGYMDGYIPSITHRDIWQRLDWRGSVYDADSGNPSDYAIVLSPGMLPIKNGITAESVGMGYDGVIHKYAVGTPTQQFVGALPALMSPGVYTVTYPSGMNMAFANMAANIDIVQAPSGGTAQFRVNGKLGGTGALVFSGTIPTTGIRGSIKKNGDPTPDLLVSDELITWYNNAGVKCLRHMTQAAVNFDQVNRIDPSQIWTGTVSGNPVTIAFQVEVCNRTNSDLWFNTSHLWSDSVLAWFFDYIETHLNPWLRCWIEISNETWNEGFTQCMWYRCEGVRRGLHTTLGDAGTHTGVIRNYSSSLATDSLYWDDPSGISKTTINAGDWVFAGRYDLGHYMWEAKVDIPANNATYAVDHGGGDNAYWKVISDNANSTIAGKRYFSEDCKRTFTIADAHFTNPRTRTVRVLGGWHGGGAEYSKESLRWKNLYQYVDKWAQAPYWDWPGGLLNYDNDTLPGFQKADKDLCVTNPTLFLEKLFVGIYKGIDWTVNQSANSKHELARWLKTEFGLPIDTIQLVSYECGFGIGVTGSWPNRAAIANLWPGIIRDTRQGPVMAYYLDKMDSKLGDTHVLFDRISAPVTTGYDNNYFQLVTWAITWGEYDTDAANARYTALCNYTPKVR